MELTPDAYVWARRLATILFPSSCLTCTADVSFKEGPICALCLARIEQKVLYRQTLALDRCASAGPFAGRMKDLIRLFKYRGKDYLAPVLAGVLVKIWPVAPFEARALVPVPMPYFRALSRGYNQAHLLAAELGKHWGLPVIEGGIRRRWNRSQTNLNREDRQKNAARGFGPGKKKINGYERVLLIDDVLTTGATLDACAQVLKQQGVRAVAALTLAYD